MVNWCKENCKGKWRDDWHRVFNEYYNGHGMTKGIGNILVFAFQNDKDAMMFMLRYT